MNTIRIYIAALIGAAIFLSYIAGANIGNVRCQARVANTTAEQIAINTKIKGKINLKQIFNSSNNNKAIIKRINSLSKENNNCSYTQYHK